MSIKVNGGPRCLKDVIWASTFVVLREKVRAVRSVRDIDGILGEIYRRRVKRRQCSVAFTDRIEVSEEI